MNDKEPEPAQKIINNLQSTSTNTEHTVLHTDRLSQNDIQQRLKNLERYNAIIQKHAVK